MKVRILALLVALTLLLAPASAFAGDAARTDIIIAQAGEPSSMDPHNCYELTAMRIYMNMFDALIRADANGQLHPSLAESWAISEDGLEYSFKLREDVQFHNGDPFTSADVVYSFERAMASPYCIEATEPMESVAAVDDYNVVVKLKYPYAPQIGFFSTTYLTIVNKNVVEERGDDFGINPAGGGTGAYQFQEWQKGVSVTMAANDAYFGGAPAIKTVVYRNISEDSAGAIAVETGDVDAFLQPSTVDVPHLRDTEGLTVYEAESYYCEFVSFNMAAEPFDKKEVREAIALCVDKNDIILAAVDGIGGVATGTIVSPRSFGYNEALAAPYPADVEKARQLLADAGLEGGFNCTITTMDNAPRKKVAEVYQAAMAQIGINAEILVVESGKFYEDVAQGNGQMYVSGMTALPADADPILFSCLSTESMGVTNTSAYSNPDFDAKMAAERSDLNEETRAATLKELQQMVYDDIPLVPSYFRVSMVAANSAIQGFEVESHNLFYIDTLSW